METTEFDVVERNVDRIMHNILYIGAQRNPKNTKFLYEVIHIFLHFLVALVACLGCLYLGFELFPNNKIFFIIILALSFAYLVSPYSKNNQYSFLEYVVYNCNYVSLAELEEDINQLSNLNKKEAKVLQYILPCIHNVTFYQTRTQFTQDTVSTRRLRAIYSQLESRIQSALSWYYFQHTSHQRGIFSDLLEKVNPLGVVKNLPLWVR